MTATASAAPAAKGTAEGPSFWRRLWHNLPAIVVMALAATIIVAVAVLPLRTWLDQRELRAETEAELQTVEREVAELDAQLELLQTDAEIERQARENFGLVFPGEESYRILPPADD